MYSRYNSAHDLQLHAYSYTVFSKKLLEFGQTTCCSVVSQILKCLSLCGPHQSCSGVARMYFFTKALAEFQYVNWELHDSMNLGCQESCMLW